MVSHVVHMPDGSLVVHGIITGERNTHRQFSSKLRLYDTVDRIMKQWQAACPDPKHLDSILSTLVFIR